MRTTIRLDDQLLEKAKQYALAHGTTFTAIVEDALREKLLPRPSYKKKVPVKLKTVNGNGVNPGIDLTALLYGRKLDTGQYSLNFANKPKPKAT